MAVRVVKPAFNLRDKLTQLDGTVPYEKMPPGSIWLLNHTTSATRTNVSSNQTWTSLAGLSIDVTQRTIGSTLWVEHNFTMELHGGINGLHFRVYREVVGSSWSATQVYLHAQHSHWSASLPSWSGPGTIYLTFMDEPNTPLGQKIRYYVQCYKEAGNNLYSNYGQDESGIQNTVWEIKK
tara:strand:- start:228 stop:767 length:540 start_codon:yes stop_codon:yes gene_type:complete